MQNNKHIWVISKSQRTKKNLSKITSLNDVEGYDYAISDIGYYLLNPNALKLERTLIGYEILEKKSYQFFHLTFLSKNAKVEPKRYLCSLNVQAPTYSNDQFLQSHIKAFNAELLRNDPIIKQLQIYDLRKAEKINALYRDIDGTLCSTGIEGNVEAQRDFILNNIGREINVLWKKGAYLEDGVFNLKSQEFTNYNQNNHYGLFIFTVEGKELGFVYQSNIFHYWIEDAAIIRYLVILQHALEMDEDLYATIGACLDKKKHAIYMQFNQKPIDELFVNHTPHIYERAFKLLNISEDEQKTIIRSLDAPLDNIGLKYVSGEDKKLDQQVMMKITFLHNIDGATSLQKLNPKLYYTLLNLAKASEMGRYYVLEKKTFKVNEPH